MLVNIKYALENICSKSSLMSLIDKKTLPKRKSTKKKKNKKQVIDMETLAKIIQIVATYIVIVKKKGIIVK
jgi:hypothetical protein